MCQVDSNETVRGGYHSVIPFYEQNNAKKHLYDRSSTINKLEPIIREHKLLSIHYITYTLHEQTKHAHMDEYMYKNEKNRVHTSLSPQLELS